MDAFVCGNRIAGRYIVRAEHRKHGPLEIEICMLGELDDGGRPCRIDQLTRTVT